MEGSGVCPDEKDPQRGNEQDRHEGSGREEEDPFGALQHSHLALREEVFSTGLGVACYESPGERSQDQQKHALTAFPEKMKGKPAEKETVGIPVDGGIKEGPEF